MTSQKATARCAELDPLSTILERLSALATTVFGEHTNDADMCATCGSAWPCDQVVLADHNLAVL